MRRAASSTIVVLLAFLDVMDQEYQELVAWVSHCGVRVFGSWSREPSPPGEFRNSARRCSDVSFRVLLRSRLCSALYNGPLTVDVLLELNNDKLLITDYALDEIADRNNANRLSSLKHRQMAHALLGHDGHAFVNGLS